MLQGIGDKIMSTAAQTKYEVKANDKDLTVLLLLKDRSLFTWRWMAYANKSHFPFKVFIADGGKDKTVQEILSDRSHFPNVNYEYVRYPYDEDYSKYYAKVLDVLSRIDAPFVVHASNDDFYFVESLRRSIDFLKSHPDYIASGGDINDFVVESCRQYGLSPFYGSAKFTGRIFPGQDLIDDTAMGRLRAYFCGIVNTFLWPAIHRTSKLKEAYQILSNINPGDLYFGDHLVYSLTIAAGKTRREGRMCLLHQANSQESLGAKIAREIPTCLHWIRRKDWFKDFSNFIEAVGKAVAAHDGISIENARENFKHIYLSLIGRNIVKIFYPQNEQLKTETEYSSTLLAEESYEFKMIKEFLADGPSGMEIRMRRKNLGFLFEPVILLKRLKKIFR